MQVYKFGGASVQDADGVINVKNIIEKQQGFPLLIVVSAMGKTTNMLELLTKAYVQQSDEIQSIFLAVKRFHYQIMEQLFAKNNAVFNEVENSFVEIDWILEEEPHDDYDFIYDQIVSIGELVSTRIVAAYLNYCEIATTWIDARSYILTDNTYREGVIDWENTKKQINNDVPDLLDRGLVLTQGFLGGTSENYTTTLGREGSDYSAAVFAACLNATSVTIWKDVPGVLNADPKLFNDTQKFDELSYAEAIEMTYYGATVIHPKTIKPLRNAHIPLYVKPYLSPDQAGTKISEDGINNSGIPIIIVKSNQVLVSIASKDFSFITENHLSEIFSTVAKLHIKINMMQISALSFTICIDFEDESFKELARLLTNQQFDFKYNKDLHLYTVKHYRVETTDALRKNRTVLLEQHSRNTAQLVVQ